MKNNGWTWKNILIGLVLVVLGRGVAFSNALLAYFVSGDSDRVPVWFYIFFYIGFTIIAIGSLGFWLVIPAFQKWGKSKPWLAWIFLAIAAIIVVVFLLLFKT